MPTLGVMRNSMSPQFRQQFDIVVVDSSPVLPVADALLIGQQVDAVVLSALCQVSRLNNLFAAWQPNEAPPPREAPAAVQTFPTPP